MKQVMHKKVRRCNYGSPLNIDTSASSNLYSSFWNKDQPLIPPKTLQGNPNLYTVSSNSSAYDLGLVDPKYSNGVVSTAKTTFRNGKFNNFMNSNWGSAINTGLNVATSFIPEKDLSGSKRASLAKGLDAGYDAAMAGVAAIPGVGTAISGLMALNKGLSKGLDAIGVGTDRMTTADAILDSPFLKLSVGWANALGGKKADKFNVDKDTNQQIGSSYGGSLSLFDKAGNLSGKKYGLVSGRQRRKANKKIAEANRQQGIMTGIAEDATDDFMASNNPMAYGGLQMSRSGGFQATAIGKKGIKLFSKEQIENTRRMLSSPQKFQEGGKMNVIPDGALHARKHNMDLEGITKKGIPVVTEKEDGGTIQQAEIERDEIIFTLEITKKLEDLMKDGSDEAAIEAGKLLVQEILYNTDDKTGLLDKVE